MSANDKQVGGTHYKMEGEAVEHWDMVIQHRLNYFEGQITKYVMRCRKKHGKQDLQKALHFLEKYLECYDRIVDGSLQGQSHVNKSSGNVVVYDDDRANVRLADSGDPGPGYVNQ